MSDFRNSDVVRLRPRTSDDLPSTNSSSSGDHDPPGSDDEGYHPESRDDHRTRMRVNIAALIFTSLLTVAGIWLAISLADLHKTQDCVLMGRRNCAAVPDQAVSPRSDRTPPARFASSGLMSPLWNMKSPSYSGHKNPS